MREQELRKKSTHGAYRGVDWLLRHSLRILPASLLTEKCALWWGYRFQPAGGVVSLRSGPRIQITHVDHLQILIYYLGTFEPYCCLLYTSPSPRDRQKSRMP